MRSASSTSSRPNYLVFQGGLLVFVCSLHALHRTRRPLDGSPCQLERLFTSEIIVCEARQHLITPCELANGLFRKSRCVLLNISSSLPLITIYISSIESEIYFR